VEVHNCVATFTSHGKLHEFGAEKPISWAEPAHLHFFTIKFTYCLGSHTEHMWRFSNTLQIPVLNFLNSQRRVENQVRTWERQKANNKWGGEHLHDFQTILFL
jgi:hypothetical protein